MTSHCACSSDVDAATCTYRKQKNKGQAVVGIIICTDNADDTKRLDEYAAAYNASAANLYESGMMECVHLCSRHDLVGALLAINRHDFFGDDTDAEVIAKTKNQQKYNQYVKKLIRRFTELLRQRAPYIFKYAEIIHTKYATGCESRLHVQLSWSLIGQKQNGVRAHCGELINILNILRKPHSKILLQIMVPDGGVHEKIRYWDIKVHISACGKVDNGESHMAAIIRETAEEIDIDLSTDIISEAAANTVNEAADNKATKQSELPIQLYPINTGVHMYYCYNSALKSAGNLELLMGRQPCGKCTIRNNRHSSVPMYLRHSSEPMYLAKGIGARGVQLD